MQVLKTGTEMRISMNIKQHRVNRGLIYLVGGGIIAIQVILLICLGYYKSKDSECITSKTFWSSTQGAPEAREILNAENNTQRLRFFNVYEQLNEFIIFFYHCAETESGKISVDIEDASGNSVYHYAFEPCYMQKDTFCLMGHPEVTLERNKYYNIVIRAEDMREGDFLEVGTSTYAQNEKIFEAAGKEALFTGLNYTFLDRAEVREMLWNRIKRFFLLDACIMGVFLLIARKVVLAEILKKAQERIKQRISKGFCLWNGLGLMLFIITAGGFAFLSECSKSVIDMETLADQSEQLHFSDGTLIAEGNETQLFFNIEHDTAVNYIDISVKSLNAPTAAAKLYCADSAEKLDEAGAISFYLNEGYNEIRVAAGKRKCFRLDILGSGFSIDAITVRPAVNPRYQIPWSFFFFLSVWNVFYFAAAKSGIRYRGIKKSCILLPEAMFAVFIIIVMLFAVGRIKYRLTMYMLIPAAVLILTGLYSRTRTDRVRIKILLCASLAGMAGVMCVVGYQMLSRPSNDLGTIYQSAWEIANNGKINTVYTGLEEHRWFFESSNNDYFVRYHNNIPLLAILAVYYKGLSFFGLNAADLMSNYMSVLLNIAAIMATVVFGMRAAKNLLGQKGMVVYLTMSVLFVPYYINACRFYTDTMSMPFVALTLWLCTIDDRTLKRPWIKYLIMSISLAVGALVKGSVMVMFVAVLIYLILRKLRNIRYVLLMLVIVAGINGAWGHYIENCSWIDMSNNNALEFPLTHYFMMGINRETNGNYAQADFEYTEQYNTKAAKQRANIDKIKQRIVNFGTLGELSEFEFGKAADTWFDGQYMQNEHIAWGIKKGGIYDGLITGRKYNNLFKIYIQLFTFTMHVFAAAGALLSIKRPKADGAMFLRLIMLGVLFFFMLWESKSRYLLNFTPVFMLAAICGAEAIHRSRKFYGGKINGK